MLIQTKNKKLDTKQTQGNVRAFFEQELPIIMAQAHINYIDLKSPIIDDMPRSRHVGNAMDNKATNYIQARQWLKEIIEAIKYVPEKPRQFLKYRYLDNLTWTQVEVRSGYSRKRGQDLINDGFIYFANSFIDTYDFRVWQ